MLRVLSAGNQSHLGRGDESNMRDSTLMRRGAKSVERLKERRKCATISGLGLNCCFAVEMLGADRIVQHLEELDGRVL